MPLREPDKDQYAGHWTPPDKSWCPGGRTLTDVELLRTLLPGLDMESVEWLRANREADRPASYAAVCHFIAQEVVAALHPEGDTP